MVRATTGSGSLATSGTPKPTTAPASLRPDWSGAAPGRPTEGKADMTRATTPSTAGRWTGRLGDLGITLPDVAASVATYVPAVRSGTKVFSAGQLPSSMAR
jgi:hypothetical protein